MNVAKWIVSGVIIASLIAGVVQVFLLKEALLDQTRILMEIQQRDVLDGEEDISAKDQLYTSELVKAFDFIPLAGNLNDFKALQNPIITRGAPGEWDDTWVSAGRLYFNLNWTPPWRIYYAGWNAQGGAIGFAEADSPVGPYTKYSGNPVLTAPEGCDFADTFSMLIRGDSDFLAYFQSVGEDGFFHVFRATSTDGTTWTNITKVIDGSKVEGGVAIPVAYFDFLSKKYYLICTRFLPSPDLPSLAYIEYPTVWESTDSINFTKIADIDIWTNPFTFYGPNNPSFSANGILKLGSYIAIVGQMHFRIKPEAGDDTVGSGVALAITQNLTEWVIYPQLILTKSGTESSFTGGYPYLYWYEDKIYLVYTYRTLNVAGDYNIGMAVIPQDFNRQKEAFSIDVGDSSLSEQVVKKILVDPDVKACPQSFIGGFNHPIQTYRYHQYVVFVDHDGEIKFAKRQIGDDYWNVYPTGITQGINDNHRAPHFGFDKNGHIIFFYNTYGGDGPPRWRVSTAPEDPSSWSDEHTTLSGSDDVRVSYPVMIRFFDENETLLLLYEEAHSNWQTSRYHLDKWNPDTKTWEALHHPLVNPPQESEGWLYFTETKQVDRRNRLHLFFLWRWTATGGNDDNRNICYMMTDDGGQTWKKSDGTTYNLPVTYESAEIVDEVGTRYGLFVPDASFDENDNPVVLYTKNDANGIQQYFVGYLEGEDWVKEQISQKTHRGHLNLPRTLRWRLSPVAYRIVVSTEGDSYVLIVDPEYGDGLTLLFKKKGSLSWQRYSLISDALIESGFQVDIWKWNFWGNCNVLDILAIEGASLFDRGLKPYAPLYVYEFYPPHLSIGKSPEAE